MESGNVVLQSRANSQSQEVAQLLWILWAEHFNQIVLKAIGAKFRFQESQRPIFQK